MLNGTKGAGRLRHVAAAVAAAAALVVASGLAPLAQRQDGLPDAPGVEVVRAKCLGCHEADLIVQQRLARAGWGRELDKMERWGAVLTAAEKTAAGDYLAAHFAPARSGESASAPPTAAVLDAGKASLERRCLGCHGTDLVDQQRLDRAGWGRELDKMVRWGATIPAAERDALTTYLSTRYGRNR